MADHPNLPHAPSNHQPTPPLLQTDARSKPASARRLGLAPPPRATGAAKAAVVESAAAPQSAPVKKPTKKRAPKVPAAVGSCAAKKAMTAAVSAHPHQAAVVLEPFLPDPAARMPLMGAPAPPQLDSTIGACSPLDQMHASMDDESFFNFTCGPSQEFTQNDVDAQSQEFAQEDSIIGDGDGIVGDGDGEGFVDDQTPRRATRGVNFTQKEDEALCNAWLAIGVDPITGNEQTTNTYWERIHAHYREHSRKPRTIVSLQHRWSIINEDCFKWSNCLAQVDRINPSGTGPVDKLNISRTLYIGKPKKKGGKPGKAFNLFHCWSILGEEEKWKNRSSNEIPNKRKATLVGEGFELDTDDEGSSSPKRPEGRKKAKDARAKGGENMYKESLDNMMTVRKELAKERREVKNKEIEERKLVEERKVLAEERKAAAEEKRVELEERKLANEEMLKRMEQEQKLMFMDPSTLYEKGRAYWELCRDQILMARGYVGGHGGGNGGGGDGGNGGGDM